VGRQGVDKLMATQPKPKPKPEPDPPEPKPEDDDAAAVDPEATEGQPPGLSLLDRVENLEHRMDAIEERVNAPPIGLGKRP
jgi:hypothetical protein